MVLEIIMRKIFFIIIISTSSIFAEECSNKQLLINLLQTEGVWKAISTTSKEKIYGLDNLQVDKNGVVAINTYNSDFNSVLFGIKYGFSKPELYLSGGKQYRLDTKRGYLYQKYYNSQFILQPYKDDCSLKKLVISIKILDKTYSCIEKEKIILEKVK